MKLFKVALLSITLNFAAQANDIVFNPIETKHWVTVNDNVMGGVSTSRFYHENDYGVFEGLLSLENNGGFASTRRVISPDFTQADVIRLMVKGDGRRYQFRLKTHGLYEGAAYVAEFSTTADQWLQIQFTEQDFTPRFRGQYLSDAPTLKFSDVMQVGLLIADKKEGQFKIQVKAIESLGVI